MLKDVEKGLKLTHFKKGNLKNKGKLYKDQIYIFKYFKREDN